MNIGIQRSALIMVIAYGLESTGEVSGQCTVYTANEMPGVCGGSLYLGDCPGTSPDSVVWSNGAIGFCQGPPGTYAYQAWLNGAVLQSGAGAIGSFGWEFSVVYAGSSSSGYAVLANVEIPYCASTVISPCCYPQQDQVEVYLVQDGANLIQDQCISCHDHWCAPGSVGFFDVPCGHTYRLRVVDSTCAGQVDDTLHTIIVHNNANLELDTAVLGSVPGFFTGSVELIEAVPDTTEIFPIYGPVTGTAVLYEGLNSSTIVAQYGGVTDAIWTGLDTGYYRICFVPDSGCQVICDTLYVPAVPGNAVSDSPKLDVLSLMPTVTTGMLSLRSQNGAAIADITITNVLGREVLTMRILPGPFSVEQLPRAAYVLTAVQGSERLRLRFLKE